MPSLSLHLLFLLFSISFSANSFHDDRHSLLAFKNDITSDPHASIADWTPAAPFCNWTAVKCSRHHIDRVVSLNLSYMDLAGSISPALGNLSFLRSLDLSNNALHGHIPTQLGRLFRLRSLFLHRNQLEGNIPTSLGNCTNLTLLALSYNNLTGSIPRELGSLKHLQQLYLGANILTGNLPFFGSNMSTLTELGIYENKLTGSIPHELGLLTHLQTLYLYENELVGTIPASLSNISTLIDLDVSVNKLTGSIPKELGLLTSLQSLHLFENELVGTIPASLSNISTLIGLSISKNKLTGCIPQELGLLTHLQTLYLYENELVGTIPASLSNISTLIDLEVSTNKLTGSIPHQLGLLTHLQTLILYENELVGTIPASLSNISNLSVLILLGNQLSGIIPNSICNCSKLRSLSLSNNKLSGSVPIELGKLSFLERLFLNNNELDSGSATTMPFLVALINCSRLKDIHLHNNKLSGVLPLSIGKLSTNLSYLSLSGNMIEGNIPPHIGNLTSLTFLNLSGNLLNGSLPSLSNIKNLERLDLGNNKLEGKIPDDFEHLQRLGLLDISKNMLSGKIPNSLAPLKQLRNLLLHHNWLSGNIPSSLGNCTNLELLDLSHNRLTGSIPREISKLYNIQFYLNFSWNLLEGSLPREIGKIAMAQAIDISANHLTGVIPSTIGSCVELQSLNLSRNSFQGFIPDSIENLRSLMSLDLSSNSLSGIIPVTLNKLKMLQYLNLSFNKLTGEIPKGGIFANQSFVVSLNGNPNLCGPEVFHVSACPKPKGHHQTIVKIILLPVIGVVSFILCFLLLRVCWRGSMHIQNIHVSRAIFQNLEHRRISYQELHIATNGFSEANLLGKGSFGLVYKGILSDGTLVAVKVFQSQIDQDEKSFKAECNVLKKVRHRNLVKIITSCSNLHFKGLVFELISNGSLEKHLYSKREDNNGEDDCELGLKTRLDIAIDVAHAMKYLHHDSFVQVVHCDIKPSNVLLDENMLAHVTDFGIARLIGESSTTSVTSTLALRGSVGYIAPEYGLSEAVSTQGDVYSYGILLLEILTRKQPTSGMFVGDLTLHNWVNSTFPNKVKEVIDSGLLREVDGDEYEEENVYKCLVSFLRVGLLCSRHSREERPTMKVVVAMLESIREDFVPNSITSRGVRRSISNLLSNSNAIGNDVPASNEQSSSTF